jgi:hypothetical protein
MSYPGGPGGNVVYVAPPPPGVVPDFHQAYEATELIACICVFLPAAMVVVAIRAWTRARIVGKSHADDCKWNARQSSPVSSLTFLRFDVVRFCMISFDLCKILG